MYGNRMQTVFPHAQPHSIVFMTQQVPFHFRKTSLVCRKKIHTHSRTSALKSNWKLFDSGDLALGWRRTFYKRGNAISVKAEADWWSTISFFLLLLLILGKCGMYVNLCSEHMFVDVFSNVLFLCIVTINSIRFWKIHNFLSKMWFQSWCVFMYVWVCFFLFFHRINRARKKNDGMYDGLKKEQNIGDVKKKQIQLFNDTMRMYFVCVWKSF